MSPETEVAILNYHRITDQRSSGWNFHDLAMPRFQAQMMLLAGRVTKVDGPILRLDNGRFVILTFDDGFAEHLTVGTLLRERGLFGTFSVISSFLQMPGHLSAGDVKQLVGLGHRIASHTVSHRQLPLLSAAELFSELGDSKAVLEDLTGQPIEWLVPPGGMLCQRSLAVATELGFKVVRTMDWGYAALPLCGTVPCLPILPQYSLRRFEGVLDGRANSSLFNAKRYLKSALGDEVYSTFRNTLARNWRGVT